MTAILKIIAKNAKLKQHKVETKYYSCTCDMKFIRFLPVVLCAVLIAAYFIWGRGISVETLVTAAPKNALFAALFMIVLYAGKSLSIFFPILILYAASGFLFPFWAALLVNLLGITTELSVAYGTGRASGVQLAQDLYKKYPKVQQFIEQLQGKGLFMPFFLRVIFCLPMDVVSMCFGAIKMPFKTYIAGSLLGATPSMISITLIGDNIKDPASPMFWTGVILTVVFTVISLLVYFLWQKRNKK